MAFVVARADGRFEIRESITTPRGPRGHTLATFRQLSDHVLDTAETRATRPFDRRAVEAKALTAGARRDPRQPTRLAHRLIEELRTGRALPPALAGALAHELRETLGSLPDTLPPAADWLGATLRDRGDALRDLLRLTDRLPPGRRRPRRPFPRIASAPS